MDAVNCQGGAGIDRSPDTRVGHRAANEDGVERALQLDVVRVTPVPEQQPSVLTAQYAPPD